MKDFINVVFIHRDHGYVGKSRWYLPALAMRFQIFVPEIFQVKGFHPLGAIT